MNLFISMAIWWTPVAAIMLALQLTGKGKVAWQWLLAAIIVFATYSMAVFFLPRIDGFPELGEQYNWTGKIAAILTTIAMILIAKKSSPHFTNETLGLTLRQNEGSLRPAAIATAAMVALVVTLQLIGGNNPPIDAETFAYQAIIPGIDEELMFRGLLLAIIAAALTEVKNGWRWAGILVTVIFAFGHSFFYQPDGSQFDPIALGYTAILGGLMMFIRLRTGSILIPILAHNLTNVVNKLV